MKFQRSDTSLEDYARRRAAYFKHLCETEPPTQARARKMLDWMDENSPFEPHEKIANLLRAIWGDERH